MEDVQIQPGDLDSIANLLNDANIDYIQSPASCTDTIGNACDRSKLFKSTTEVLVSSSSTSLNDFHPTLEDALNSIDPHIHNEEEIIAEFIENITISKYSKNFSYSNKKITIIK